MQSLNDDMDELFRRAGEEYPLNTNGADWNKVLQELHQKDNGLIQQDNKKKNYRYLWLLLLLPMGFIIGRYIGNDNKPNDFTTNKEINRTIEAPKANPNNAGAVTGISKKHENKEPVKVEVKRKEAVSKANNRAGSLPVRKSNKSIGNNKTDVLTITGPKLKPSIKAAIPVESNNNNKSLYSSSKPSTEYFFGIKDRGNIGSGTTTAVDNKMLSGMHSVKIGTRVIDTTKSNTVTKEAPKSLTKKNQNTFSSKLSYSFLIGPDVSTIKLQRTSKVGYSAGFMLGYQLSSKFTIEGGVLWDKKTYYTDGRYVDTARFKLPPHSVVINAEGYCNMIELPVNIRYNFKTEQNQKWFVSAGLSSYLMHKEEYDLNYERYNQAYVKDYGYMNSTKDWFSILNLSAGYQKSIGRNTGISIAPYVKLPLRGVGIGKLPISSTGLYISVSKFKK